MDAPFHSYNNWLDFAIMRIPAKIDSHINGLVDLSPYGDHECMQAATGSLVRYWFIDFPHK